MSEERKNLQALALKNLPQEVISAVLETFRPRYVWQIKVLKPLGAYTLVARPKTNAVYSFDLEVAFNDFAVSVLPHVISDARGKYYVAHPSVAVTPYSCFQQFVNPMRSRDEATADVCTKGIAFGQQMEDIYIHQKQFFIEIKAHLENGYYQFQRVVRVSRIPLEY